MNSQKTSNSDNLILKIRKGKYANYYRHTHANKMFAAYHCGMLALNVIGSYTVILLNLQ